MTTDASLTLEDAATELGVHYQTAYRWVRAGRLPAVKVDGQYRVEPKDLDQLQAKRQRPAEPPRPSTTRLERQRLAMSNALLAGDEPKAVAIARSLAADGTPVSVLIEEVLAPPLVEIGASWRRGETNIYTEHRASAIVTRLLGELTANPRGRRRGVAVVTALSGDLHVLPTAMATAALREDHWTVEHLGADMPLEEVERFLQTHQVDLVVLSATGEGAVEQASTAKIELEARHGIPVLVGGTGTTITGLLAVARTVPSGSG